MKAPVHSLTEEFQAPLCSDMCAMPTDTCRYNLMVGQSRLESTRKRSPEDGTEVLSSFHCAHGCGGMVTQ